MKEKSAAPQVSIIIPVYNSEPYLRRCLNSIQAQTLKEWECICVNDGSTDGSEKILDEYAAKDARFVVIHKENGGTSSARNAGLDVARGEYIGFVDNDDWIEAETYEAALESARLTGADIVQWRYKTEGKNESESSKEFSEGFFDIAENLDYYDVHIWNKLFKSNIIFENSIRFPTGAKIGGEDDIFSIFAYMLAKKSFFINRVLYCHDIAHDHLMLRSHTVETLTSFAEEVRKAFDHVQETMIAKNAKIEKHRAFDSVIFSMKMNIKPKALFALPKPDCSLFHAVFPELNRQMPRYFLKKKSMRALIMLLAAWHLDLPARALLRIRLWKKALKAKIRAKR